MCARLSRLAPLPDSPALHGVPLATSGTLAFASTRSAPHARRPTQASASHFGPPGGHHRASDGAKSGRSSRLTNAESEYSANVGASGLTQRIAPLMPSAVS